MVRHACVSMCFRFDNDRVAFPHTRLVKLAMLCAPRCCFSCDVSAQPGYVNITASHCEDAKLRAWAWCPLALHALPPLQRVSGMQDSSSLFGLVMFSDYIHSHILPDLRISSP